MFVFKLKTLFTLANNIQLISRNAYQHCVTQENGGHLIFCCHVTEILMVLQLTRNLLEICYHSSINFDADSKSVLEIKKFPISKPFCGEGVSTHSTHKQHVHSHTHSCVEQAVFSFNGAAMLKTCTGSVPDRLYFKINLALELSSTVYKLCV